MPAVSVIMPVYNAESFLQEAIESILTQSFRDFEFLIFNDGSTDNSKQIIQSISDPRIKLFDSDINQGYVSLLNKGIDLAHGKYIARMDADDIAHPHRLQKQFDKLEQHPDHVICGTRFTTVGSNQVTALPLEDDDIKLKMLYITPFCHPSVMIRAAVLKDHQLRYEHDYMPAEDYQLWVTLSDYGKFCNLSESLMHYRVHHNNISMKERSRQQRLNQAYSQLNYITKFFQKFGLAEAEQKILHKLFFKENFSYHELKETGELLQTIVNSNSNYPVSRDAVYALLMERYYYRCTTSTHLGIKSFVLANQYDFMRIPVVNNMKLFIKSILKYKG